MILNSNIVDNECHDHSRLSSIGNAEFDQTTAEFRQSRKDYRRSATELKASIPKVKNPVLRPRESCVGDKMTFFDPEAMKDKVREALLKPVYDVKDFYFEEGLWQQIARSSRFENITLMVISFNAIWLSIDTELNKAAFLFEADYVFQIAEQCFCFYFSFEWTVRFMSFNGKKHCLKDGWFIFDSCLVFSMVAETWVMTTIMVIIGGSGSGSPLGNMTILRLFRLLRLSRLARMLRSMPELMILIKGMVAAMRSVFFVLVLLVILMYIFAITFTQLLEGTDVGGTYFSGIFASMLTLTCNGTFLDNVSDVVYALLEAGVVYMLIFLLFILLAALTILNMLIGVLCEVVSAVAATEKEEMLVLFVRGRMRDVLSRIDKDGDGLISRREFERILGDHEAVTALVEVGVDPEVLVDNVDYLFEVEGDAGEEGDEDTSNVDVVLDFGRFMEVIMQFRGSNTASLKDVVDLRNQMSKEFRNLFRKLRGGKISNVCPDMSSGPPCLDDSAFFERGTAARSSTTYDDYMIDESLVLKSFRQHACCMEAFYFAGHSELYRIQKILPTKLFIKDTSELGFSDCQSIKSLPWESTGERLSEFFQFAQEESDELRALFIHMMSPIHECAKEELRTWLARVDLIVLELRHFIRALQRGSASDLAVSWHEAVAFQELLGVELTKLQEIREITIIKRECEVTV